MFSMSWNHNKKNTGNLVPLHYPFSLEIPKSGGNEIFQRTCSVAPSKIHKRKIKHFFFHVNQHAYFFQLESLKSFSRLKEKLINKYLTQIKYSLYKFSQYFFRELFNEIWDWESGSRNRNARN
jgi:hypothetical protein